MNWIRQEKRLAIYVRDGLACVYCGDSVENGAQLTLDHVLPYTDGGLNGAANLLTACHRCNSSRGARPLAEWVRAVAQYVDHGVTAKEIMAHALGCVARPVDVAAAKKMIALRGSVARF